jgi:hypothetical protein
LTTGGQLNCPPVVYGSTLADQIPEIEPAKLELPVCSRLRSAPHVAVVPDTVAPLVGVDPIDAFVRPLLIVTVVIAVGNEMWHVAVFENLILMTNVVFLIVPFLVDVLYKSQPVGAAINRWTVDVFGMPVCVGPPVATLHSICVVDVFDLICTALPVTNFHCKNLVPVGHCNVFTPPGVVNVNFAATCTVVCVVAPAVPAPSARPATGTRSAEAMPNARNIREFTMPPFSCLLILTCRIHCDHERADAVETGEVCLFAFNNET